MIEVQGCVGLGQQNTQLLLMASIWGKGQHQWESIHKDTEKNKRAQILSITKLK